MCFKQIWKVGKVGKVGKGGKVGKVGREGLSMPTLASMPKQLGSKFFN